MDLYEQITRLTAELDASIRELAKNGEALAAAERDYKMELTKTALALRADDMAVTLINQVIYGLEPVANKRFDRDVAEATYKANQEHINITKLKLRLLESQLSREWGAIHE
jgi:hypothetical protein